MHCYDEVVEGFGWCFSNPPCLVPLRRLFEFLYLRTLNSLASEALREGWYAEKIIKAISQLGDDLSSSGLQPFRSR